ncbi:hypothetical protein [Streptococcus sp. DD11]|uniref:hypothetical protein n=1 Tax=Streptococcus sp. DD11 TaxID=1777879 RepID=UPI000A9C6B3F|nr:hypothetical protein [Streptococcus sp. DD11]
MSIDMYLGNSQSQAASTDTMTREELHAYEDLEGALADFEASTDVLKGRAYDSARAYSEQVLRPLVRGGKMLSEAVGQAVKRFPASYIEQVANESLKESQLEADIQRLDMVIAAAKAAKVSSAVLGNPVLAVQHQKIIDIASEARRVLQEKLDKLRNFNAVSPLMFSEIEILKSLVDTGLSQLSTGWDANKGVYVLPANLTWATQLMNYTPMTPQTDKDKIINDLKTTYGLDNESANALYNLQQGILKKANKEGWDNQKVIYEYNRLLASFVPDNYVSTRWKAICGTEDKAERDKLCKEYGLSDKDIAILEVSIKKQHADESQSKDLAHEAVQLAAFTEKSWDLNPKNDGVHTLSHIANDGLEHEEISFKGDVDSGRYSDSDFNSDLDAINYYRRATAEGVDRSSVFNISSDYNTGVKSNSINRVKEFYDNYDYPGLVFGIGQKDGEEVVEEILDTKTLGSHHISKQYTNQEQEQHKKDFLDYLERGKDKNVK